MNVKLWLALAAAGATAARWLPRRDPRRAAWLRMRRLLDDVERGQRSLIDTDTEIAIFNTLSPGLNQHADAVACAQRYAAAWERISPDAPGSCSAQLLLSRALALAGRLSESEVAGRRRIALTERLDVPQARSGTVHLERREARDFVLAHERVDLASLLYHQRRYADALDELDCAEALGQSIPEFERTHTCHELLCGRAWCLLRLARVAGAPGHLDIALADTLDRLLHLPPEAEAFPGDAARECAWLQLTDALATGDAPAARRHLEEVAPLETHSGFPESPRLLRARAEALRLEGRQAEADRLAADADRLAAQTAGRAPRLFLPDEFRRW